MRRSAVELRRAVELRAALAERERLARTIHDGVLQVLAQVSRRGRAAGERRPSWASSPVNRSSRCAP